MKRKSILLIENNKNNIKNIKGELGRLGIEHALRVAQNGADGLEVLTASQKGGLPDLILINSNVPKMSGYEFLSVVKSYHTFKDIKVYVIANAFEDYDRMMVKNLGGEGLINTPLSLTAEKQGEAIE